MNNMQSFEGVSFTKEKISIRFAQIIQHTGLCSPGDALIERNISKIFIRFSFLIVTPLQFCPQFFTIVQIDPVYLILNILDKKRNSCKR